jgi:hypothetical protein
MVAMNSIPQQEVANGKGQIEFLRASPTTFSKEVAINPSPIIASGASTIFNFVLYCTGRDIINF